MVNLKIQIILIVASTLFLAFILALIRKKYFAFKYALIWLVIGVIMLLLAIKPDIADFTARLLGIGLPINAVFLLGMFFVLVVLLTFTMVLSRIIVSMQKLSQEQALMKAELERLRKPGRAVRKK